MDSIKLKFAEKARPMAEEVKKKSSKNMVIL